MWRVCNGDEAFYAATKALAAHLVGRVGEAVSDPLFDSNTTIVARWNDRSGQTAEVVVAEMRAAAAKLGGDEHARL